MALVAVASWIARRYAVLPAVALACLLAACASPVYVPSAEFGHSYRFAVTAPSPPQEASHSHPVLWVSLAALAAAVSLYALWRTRKP